MSWRMQTIIRSSSSCSRMSLLCVLWLLTVCLAPGSRAQRLREAEREKPAEKVPLMESDGVCYQEGCYAVFLQKKTFREAGRSCRERGGTLATIYNQEAAAVVHELLSAIETQGSESKLYLWIGLHRPPRQCSSTRPLRGFVWVTGDQNVQFTDWLKEYSPSTCGVYRCVSMIVHTSESGRESEENFQWLDGSCSVPLNGYVCQYNYKGMCPPLEDEGRGPPVYTTPFYLVSSLLTHVPFGSVATVQCPADGANPDPTEMTALCIQRDDETVGWSTDSPLCPPIEEPQSQDWCSKNHGCEQHCQNTDTDYYCYCSEGFTVDKDGYSCKPDTLSQTNPPELSDSAGPTDLPHINPACVEMGCEYNCMETQRGLRCTCPPGYQMAPDGRRCSDVDECQQGPCPQLCVNIPGTFHCTCLSGYQPDDEGECVDVDECLDDGSCEGVCENTVGSFRCVCGAGYEVGSEGECVDIDECARGSSCQQHCLNLIGDYECFCDNGYDLQLDRHTCQPSLEDEEYSTLTPDPGNSVHVAIFDHDIPWSSSFTPDPNFEVDTNFDADWVTEAPEGLPPDGSHRSGNHLNQWDTLSPRGYQTSPSPTQKGNIDNEINNGVHADAGSRDSGPGVPEDTANGSNSEEANMDGAEEASVKATVEAESAEGQRKHDKSWLLVALLVPLCVFLVVMLALGIVYCTSCAVDKSLRFSDCYRWILPTTPPERREVKTQA
ncbi:endosialin [Haplochromis burtoni]|uniref:Endosialin-like n=1 Tax=Haplochromis burtoni TaxID=8153 RepID=A0A3Q2WD06_HAPBU|nr:endosialin [Haplochromis burtoni]